MSEKSAFEATEKELVETQDSLERALVMILGVHTPLSAAPVPVYRYTPYGVPVR